MSNQLPIRSNRKLFKLKNIFFATMVVLICGHLQVYAKSDTIGRGTTSSNIYGPAHIAKSATSGTYSTKTIHLYRQSELAEIGIFPGAVINSMAWNKSTKGVMASNASVDIRVSLRSNIDSITYGYAISANKFINDYVGANFTFAGSQLFSAAGTNFPNSIAWVPVSFSIPYTYLGGGLEVLMDAVYTRPTSGDAASESINWYASSTKPLYQEIYTNGVTSYANTTVYYYADSRANAIFDFTPSTAVCSGMPVAGNIKMEIVTGCPGMKLVDLRLKGASNVNGIKLQWEKKVSGQSAFSPISGANSYELLRELVKSPTEYRVVVSCGANSSTSAVFSTAPVPFLTPNYTYDFETGAAWFASTVPDCWSTRKGLWEDSIDFVTTASGYNVGSWSSDGWKNVGTWGAARVNAASSAYDWLISPGINLGTGNWQLEFDLGIFTKNASTAGIFDDDDFFAVLISTDGGDTWSNDYTLRSWSTAQTPLSADGTQHVVIPLSSYSGNIAIGFYGTGGGLNPISPALAPDIMIDNFQILPSCHPKMPVAITGPSLACRNSKNTYSVPQVSGVTSYAWVLPSGWSGTSMTNTIELTPNSNSGIIKVVANNSCGTSDTQILSVVISPLPVITPDGNLQLCAGDSIELTTGASSTYKWLQNKAVVANAKDSALLVKSAGAYQVITNNGACTDTSLVKNVTVNPLPVPVIDKDNNVIFTTQTFSSYQWNFNGTRVPGATNASFVVTDSGAYTVTVTDANGCHGISDSLVTGGSNTGIDGFDLNNQQVKIYPNPVKNLVNIVFSNTLSGDEMVTIMDVTGKVLRSEGVSLSKTTIDMSSFSAGVYFIKVNDSRVALVRKVIKN